MTQLSSCYFCGAALDAPVAAYPIVPKAVADGDQRTVTLCPTCRRKLASVLNVAVDAVADADSIEPALDDDDGESVLGSAESAASPAVRQRDTEPADEGSDVEPADDAESLADESTAAGEPDAEAAPTTETSNERGSDTEGDASDEEPSPGEPDADAGEHRETDDDGDSPVGDVDPAPVADDGVSEESADEEQSPLSTPTARKVVRLLQNREFPVDREEFQVVASNAYEIPSRDCTAVVDALVADGYVNERDGQLVRPED